MVIRVEDLAALLPQVSQQLVRTVTPRRPLLVHAPRRSSRILERRKDRAFDPHGNATTATTTADATVGLAFIKTVTDPLAFSTRLRI